MDGFEEVLSRNVETGRNSNPTHQRGWFTTGYFHHPDEVLPELEEAGFRDTALYAIEGLGPVIADVGVWLDDAVLRERLLRTVRRLEQEPSVLGVSGHIMAVGRAG